jgi:inosose dehydratase
VRTHRRIAAAPISWGICEVPGWGRMLDAERVLGEMAALGITATELGAPGFLPANTTALRKLLERHGLQLVGSFLPVVAHEPDATEAAAAVRETARTLSALGADVLSLALVSDRQWSEPIELSDAQWSRLAETVDELDELAASQGITLALHPHEGTLVQTADQVRRALNEVRCGWCLDTGHLFLGGFDPAEFAAEYADRVVHVHLKDVDAAVAARLHAGELSLLQAVQAGVFTALGRGDAGVARAVTELDRAGYDRWWVLEQDTAITGPEPAVGSGPMEAVKRSLEFIETLAPTEESVAP